MALALRGGVFEEAINVLERTVADLEVRNRPADVKGAVADVAELEMRNAQMLGAAPKPERLRSLLFAAAIAAHLRRHRRIRLAVGAAHKNLVPLDAPVCDFNCVLEPVLAAISCDQHF